MTERVTLITGASAGIGTELARVFASNGHRVALVARRADRLKTLADELGAKGGPAPIVIPCDLQQTDAGDRIAQALTDAGVEVEYLVNNAGFGLFGLAVERDRAEQLDIINVNIRALTDLTLRFADQLIRNRGGILNLGSIAGFLPGPGMAVYYASKAYVLSFSEALRCELAPKGVRVTVVCPGPVPSEFQDRAGFAPGFDSAILDVAPAEVARQAYRGLMANKARRAARRLHQNGAVPAPAVSALLHPDRGRRVSVAQALASPEKARSSPLRLSLARDLLRTGVRKLTRC
ncbi:short-subunit dehydrogenase [Bradyrhizobium sp. JR3.5]